MDEFDVRYKTKALWSTKIIESAGIIEAELALTRKYDSQGFWTRAPQKARHRSLNSAPPVR
jgi:hypothetical protein